MKKNSFLCCCLLFLGSTTLFSQEMGMGRQHIKQERNRKFMVGVAFDAIKTDFKERIGNKVQGGLEVNYFIEPMYSVTLGADVWTTDSTTLLSGVAGIRLYAFKKLFFRARGLLGADDISTGAGFHLVLSEQWSTEGVFDYYFQGAVAARIGLTFLLTKRRGLEHK